MIRYVRIEISQIHRALWYGFIPHLDLCAYGETREQAQEAAKSLVEEAEGLKSWQPIFLG